MTYLALQWALRLTARRADIATWAHADTRLEEPHTFKNFESWKRFTFYLLVKSFERNGDHSDRDSAHLLLANSANFLLANKPVALLYVFAFALEAYKELVGLLDSLSDWREELCATNELAKALSLEILSLHIKLCDDCAEAALDASVLFERTAKIDLAAKLHAAFGDVDVLTLGQAQEGHAEARTKCREEQLFWGSPAVIAAKLGGHVGNDVEGVRVRIVTKFKATDFICDLEAVSNAGRDVILKLGLDGVILDALLHLLQLLKVKRLLTKPNLLLYGLTDLRNLLLDSLHVVYFLLEG